MLSKSMQETLDKMKHEDPRMHHLKMAVAELTVCAGKIGQEKTYKQAQNALRELNKLGEMIGKLERKG